MGQQQPTLPSGDAFRRHLSRELSRPGVLDELKRLEDARSTRKVELTSPKVIDWIPERTEDRREYGLKPLEGSVTIFWGRKGGSAIAALERAFVDRDVDKLDALHDKFIAAVAKRSLTSVAKAVEEALGAVSFFDLSFGGRPLANSVFLPKGLQVGSITLPFSGGKLDPAKFEVREHLKGRTGAKYDVLVLVAHPRLNPLERRALESVPASMQSIQIGAPSNQVITVIITIVAFVGINTMMTLCCGNIRDRLSAQHLSPADLKRLDGIGSARRLLDLRRQIFEAAGIR